MTSVNVRIAGANGDGVESSGAMLVKVAAKNGMHAFAYRGFQSIIRGGHVWNQVRISDEKLYIHGDGIDILVALNQDSVRNQQSHLNKNAAIIYDPSKINVEGVRSDVKLIKIPLLDIAVQVSGDPIMRNVVAIGAVLKMIGINIDVFNEIVKDMFTRKGEKVVNDNIKAAVTGYNYSGVEKLFEIHGDSKKRYYLDGNTALAIGAYASGCKFYAAYPMTPASGILHWFAAHENKGVLYKQTEDELAAINMTIGAASTGVRSMCGTSGGGFSLMVEALGMAGMLEVPIVVVNSQRTGPSTGLPTKTEQGDLLFVMHASQGEFPRIVIAPGSVEESFTLTSEAFNLADRYQCPVIILMDLYISEHVETIDGFDFDKVIIDRGKIAEKSDGRFKRYLFTEDGVSPRAFPGTPGMEFVAPSDEHDEYGDLVSDALSGIDEYVEVRVKMQNKRMRKIDTMLKNESVFVPKVENEKADYFFVTFGSTVGPVKEAIQILNKSGSNFGLIQFDYIMPLNAGKTEQILANKKLIDVECNFTGQLAHVIKANTGIDINNRILKYDGEAFTGKEIADKAASIIANSK